MSKYSSCDREQNPYSFQNIYNFPVMLRKNNIDLVTLEITSLSPKVLLQLTILAKLLHMKIK